MIVRKIKNQTTKELVFNIYTKRKAKWPTKECRAGEAIA